MATVTSPINNFVDYFTNIKPYHSKILEVVQKYNFYDNLSVNVADDMSRQLAFGNEPLCAGVGFGYTWDDCYGYDATDGCSLGNCPSTDTIFNNLSQVYSYPVQRVDAANGNVLISGNRTYDKTFQIKKIFTSSTFTVSGDLTDYLGREPIFRIIPKASIPFSINGMNTITVSGNMSQQFIDQKRFYVYGTGYNDRVLNVSSVIFNKSNNTTQIAVVETIIPNKPGTILLNTSTKNGGYYTIDSFKYNGTDTTITLAADSKKLSLENTLPSLIFKTGYIQNRVVELFNNDTDNNGQWQVEYSSYDPTNDLTQVTLKNALRNDTGNIGDLRLMVRLAAADYEADSACAPPKEANLSVNFTETLVIRGISNVLISPTPTPSASLTPSITPTLTPTATITPTATLTPTPTETLTPTPSTSISATPSATSTPTPTPTLTITPTPTPSSAALSAYLSDATSSGTASATCGPQIVYSDAITAITEGGCGDYVWSWEYVSGDNNIKPILDNVQATGFQRFTPNDGITYTAVYRCNVSDSCGNQVYTDTISIDITNSMGSCDDLTFTVTDSDPSSSGFGQVTSPSSFTIACTAGNGCFYPGSVYGVDSGTGLPQYYNVSDGGVLLPASRQPQYCDGNTWVNTPGITISGGSGVYSMSISNIAMTCSRLVANTDHPSAIGIMVGGSGDKSNATDSLMIFPQDDGSITTNKTTLNVPFNPSQEIYGPIFVLVSNENIPSYQMKITADVLISDTAGATIPTTLEIIISRNADNALGDYQC